MTPAETFHLGLACDALNAAIMRVEEKFASLRLGVRAGVPLEAETDARLEFGKVGGQWQLVVVNGEVSARLVSVSIEQRLRAVSLFPALLEELRRGSVEQVREVVEATRTVEAFLAAGDWR